MDPNLIYAKTNSGEEAMRQRTRVVQRNVRMVLILVDGNSTVADLSAKTGNVQLVENALNELEQSGFIELRVEQDSVWEQSKKVAAEIKAAAIGYASQRHPSADKDEVGHVTPPIAPVSVFPVSIPPVSVFPRPLVAEPLMSQFSVSPVHSVNPNSGNSISSYSIGPSETLKAPRHDESLKKPALLDRLKAFFPDHKKHVVDDDISIKPMRRGGNDYFISWPVKVVFGVVGLLALIFLSVFLFPYGRYLPDAEAALEQIAGQPVKIGAMRGSFYPKPGLILDSVRFGNPAIEKEIRISEVRLLPVLSTMMSARKVFYEAELSGVVLPAEALGGLSGIFESAAQPSAKVSVKHVILEKTDIFFRGLGFSDLNGEIKLSPDGRFQLLSVHSPDRTVHLSAKPATKGIDVELEGFAWRPSLASDLLIDSATVQGNLNAAEFALRKLEMRVFNGVLQGVAVLRSEKQPEIVGDISFERISAKRLGEFLGIGPQFEGETTGKMTFSAAADSWAAIFSRINANGEFSIRRGSLGGIDLADAARRASTTPTHGGTTRFEQLSGMFSLTPTDYRFSNLLLTSGLMQSSGQLEVSRDFQIKGAMEVQMSGTVNKLRVPLLINGPLKAPLLQAGKR
jgi:hypothetical protein